jgi:DNA-binding transcriptional MerR regulator
MTKVVTPLTVGPVARRLQISEDRVRQLANDGALRCARTSTGIRLFDAVDVERFAAERQERRGQS